MQITFLLARHKKLVTVFLILLCIIFLSNCIADSKKADIRGEAYAGAHTCKKCHEQIYDSYIQTAHFNTSSNLLPVEVKKAFENGKNVFRFNDSTEVIMEKVDGQYYQSYYRNGKKLLSHSFDITVGSGRKAQTYLYYNDRKKVSQLPVSYFMTEDAWANSPGFPANEAKFDRNVPSHCLGCHSSFVDV